MVNITSKNFIIIDSIAYGKILVRINSISAVIDNEKGSDVYLTGYEFTKIPIQQTAKALLNKILIAEMKD